MDTITQTKICLPTCGPIQVISLSYAIDDLSKICIMGDCDKSYPLDKLQYSYSTDNICWECYADLDTTLKAVLALESDYFLRIKVQGPVKNVTYDGETIEYSSMLDAEFNFLSYEQLNSTNTYNPYANMDCALGLQQQLAETVSSIVGIPIYYIRLAPNAGSKDVTFKEYALMDVEAIKQIKLIIQDGILPSSKPEFDDLGLGWQTDWETEITKGTFATAFGIDAKPMEGDLVYVPMMKRMWMVAHAYDERKDGLMWISTTFKVFLTKYQEKDSVDLKDAQSFVDGIVKNKYEELFDLKDVDHENLDSGEPGVEAPRYAANNLYPIFESDATRAYVSCDYIDFQPTNQTYYKGTLISDNSYIFPNLMEVPTIVYQKRYCGDEGSISFIIHINLAYEWECDIVEIGAMKLHLSQSGTESVISCLGDENIKITLGANVTYLVVWRWSHERGIVDLSAYPYTYDHDVPQYRLASGHFYYDLEIPYAQYNGKWNVEFNVAPKECVAIHGFDGWITNFKVFDIYEDNLSELLQMYPTHQHLLINDTARKIVDLPGVTPR